MWVWIWKLEKKYSEPNQLKEWKANRIILLLLKNFQIPCGTGHGHSLLLQPQVDRVPVTFVGTSLVHTFT